MPEVKLPTTEELLRIEASTLAKSYPGTGIGKLYQVPERDYLALVAGCREAIRLREERAKLAEAWGDYRGDKLHPNQRLVAKAAAIALLDAIASESGEGER